MAEKWTVTGRIVVDQWIKGVSFVAARLAHG